MSIANKKWWVVLSILGTLFAIIGILLNAQKNILCWGSWALSNLLFFVYFFPKKEWSIEVLNVIYICLNVWGFYRWMSM